MASLCKCPLSQIAHINFLVWFVPLFTLQRGFHWVFPITLAFWLLAGGDSLKATDIIGLLLRVVRQQLVGLLVHLDSFPVLVLLLVDLGLTQDVLHVFIVQLLTLLEVIQAMVTTVYFEVARSQIKHQFLSYCLIFVKFVESQSLTPTDWITWIILLRAPFKAILIIKSQNDLIPLYSRCILLLNLLSISQILKYINLFSCKINDFRDL